MNNTKPLELSDLSVDTEITDSPASIMPEAIPMMRGTQDLPDAADWLMSVYTPGMVAFNNGDELPYFPILN